MNKLKPLSVGQQLGWYFASLVYGMAVVAVAVFSARGELAPLWREEPIVPTAVFGFAWLFGVACMRYYVQDKDPTDIRSLLGIKRGRP